MNDLFPHMTAEEFAAGIPAFLREDRNGYALALAIGTALSHFLEAVAYADTCLTDVENMPEWALDEWAACRGMRWYDRDADVSVKRLWVRDFNKMHSCIGTKEAVEYLMRSVYARCAVQEWNDYGGEAYHFRVRVYGDYSERLEKWARAAVEIVKNCRSIMDSFAYGVDERLNLHEKRPLAMYTAHVQSAESMVLCGDADGL